MKTMASALPLELKKTEQTDSNRIVSINKALESIKRLSAEAISLERQYHAEVQRSDELLAPETRTAYDLAIGRAKRIHQERCRIVQRIASFARLATLEACGTLIIDETTAATGLDERDRSMISEVSGTCSRW